MKFNFKKGLASRCFMPEPPNFDNNCQTEGILSTVAGNNGDFAS